ncbi:MAG TPA: hypothetical protein VK638_30375 [Edaphobacter sp.]|nr:hypothetical protein [Edaphobacter sp.]
MALEDGAAFVTGSQRGPQLPLRLYGLNLQAITRRVGAKGVTVLGKIGCDSRWVFSPMSNGITPDVVPDEFCSAVLEGQFLHVT